MLALKCDRCGKYYEFYNSTGQNETSEFIRHSKEYSIEKRAENSFIICERYRNRDVTEKPIEDYDLCPECMRALYWEYYKEQIKKAGMDFTIINGEVKTCDEVGCSECVFFPQICAKQKREFLEKEHSEKRPLF